MPTKIWVCEECGTVWHTPPGRDNTPPRDRNGRILCEPCRIAAGVMVDAS